MLAFLPMIVGAKVEDTSFQVDGGHLRGQKFTTNARASNKDKEALLIIHGGPGSGSAYMKPNLSSQLMKEYDVYYYDQRGCGKSLDVTIDPEQPFVEGALQDLNQVMAKILTERGQTKLNLLGHSYGALLAGLCAAEQAKDIHKLILLSPLPFDLKYQNMCLTALAKKEPCVKKNKALQREINRLKNPAEQEAARSWAVRTHNWKEAKKYFPSIFNENKKSSEENLKEDDNRKLAFEMADKEFIESGPQWRNDLKTIQCPTMIVHGEQDFIPKGNAVSIKKSIPGSTIKYISNCGHAPHLEDPVKLMAMIKNFLKNSKK